MATSDGVGCQYLQFEQGIKMPNKWFTAVFAATVLASGSSSIAISSANAEWYVSGNVGSGILSDSDAAVTGSGSNGTNNVEYDYSYGLSGALGYSWGKFRMEGEISYRENDLDQVSSVTGGGLVFPAAGALTGETSAVAYMVNGWYDFDTGSKWVPFVGGGLGAATIRLNVESVGGAPVGFDESDTVFAYQAGVGIGYKITPKINVGLSYRLLGTTDPKFANGVNQVEAEYLSHTFFAGVRASF